jgi:thiol-disulfide isomerase/thioredoxin
MKEVLICLTVFCFSKFNHGFGQTKSSFFSDKDSIYVSGNIIDFKSGDGNEFISFTTYGTNGKGNRQSCQVSPDGSFNMALFQSFAGDIAICYRTALATVLVRPGQHLQIDIQNNAIAAGKKGNDVFLIKGELAEVNSLILAFQDRIRDHDFVQQVSLGDKELGDSLFAVNRHKKLSEELAFLDDFIKSRKVENKNFRTWQKNQIVYAAGRELLMYPFFGKMNTTISGRQLFKMIDSIPVANTSALQNSGYYEFLNMLMLDGQILVNVNPAYLKIKKENGNNTIPVNLAQFDKLANGIIRELMYFDLYQSHFESRSRKNIAGPASELFDSVIQHPYLRKSYRKLAASIEEQFKPYHIISRIRELKASAELKTRLLDTFEKVAGTSIFIDFWGDWCGPCMMEMPAYPALISKFEGKPLKFIFFSVNTTDKSISHVKDKINAEFINLTNDEVAMMNSAFEFHTYPAHFVVNSQGYVVGSNTKKAEEIERLIAK